MVAFAPKPTSKSSSKSVRKLGDHLESQSGVAVPRARPVRTFRNGRGVEYGAPKRWGQTMNTAWGPLSDRLLELAADVRRIGDGWRDDPEAVAIQKDAVANRLAALAREVDNA